MSVIGVPGVSRGRMVTFDYVASNVCKRINIRVGGLLAAGLLGLLPQAAQASENGTSNWPRGVQTFDPAIVPPPGATEYYQYDLYAKAGSYRDSNGKSAIPDFNLNFFGIAGRIVHTWKTDTGGLNFSTGITVVADHASLSAAGRHGHDTGFSEVVLVPLYLSYNTKDWHFMASADAFVPIASFKADRLFNATNNYTSYIQELAITYAPSAKFDFGVETTISVNGVNKATRYKSGTLINTDFGTDYAFFSKLPKLQLGVQGYWARQVTNDKIDGVKAGDGNKINEFALGPQVVWHFSPAAAVLAKWQKELHTENTPRTNKFWIEFAVPL